MHPREVPTWHPLGHINAHTRVIWAPPGGNPVDVAYLYAYRKLYQNLEEIPRKAS